MDYGKPPVAIGSGTLVAVGASTFDLILPLIIATVAGTIAMLLFRKYWRNGQSLGE